MAKSYHAEVKWRDERYVPTNVEEHLEISIRSSACMQIANMAFILLGDVTTSEAVEWAFTFPKIIVGVCIVGRIGNDIVSHKVPDNVSPIHTFVEETSSTCKLFISTKNKLHDFNS